MKTAPLTFTQFQGIIERYEDIDDERISLPMRDFQALIDDAAGLRDRLARAEAQVASLRGLMNEWEHQDSTRDVAYRDDLCARWLAALTDGSLDNPPAAG